MPNQTPALHPEALSERLIFRQRWWWDPVPDWIIAGLDKVVLRDLAVVQLQTQRAMLEAQMKATDQVIGILGKMR